MGLLLLERPRVLVDWLVVLLSSHLDLRGRRRLLKLELGLLWGLAMIPSKLSVLPLLLERRELLVVVQIHLPMGILSRLS